VELNHDAATDKVCPLCSKPLVAKRGKYGEFLACSGYPDCKHTESVNGGGSGKPIGMHCPEKGCNGEIVEKRSKRGKVFFGCSSYPDCKFATWDQPVDQACPVCETPYLVEKNTKRQGNFLACVNKDCGYKKSLD
jgi:DNA topoisomerase-1